MGMNRRQMLAGVAAAAAATGITGAAAHAAGTQDARLAAMLDRHAISLRALGGDDDGPVGDRSLEGRAAARRANTQRISELASVPRDSLSATARIDHDAAAFVYSVLEDQLARPGTIELDLRPSPYVVSQMNGAYYWLPPQLGARLKPDDAASRSAYLDTIAALARGVDQESARILHDGAQGVTPPDFVLAATCVTAIRPPTPCCRVRWPPIPNWRRRRCSSSVSLSRPRLTGRPPRWRR
jgi:uncharacterized protein (DUF885 family)